jgi:hypothetical protein
MWRSNIIPPPTAWEVVVQLGVDTWKGKPLMTSLCRLGLGSSVYHIWRNNAVKHGSYTKTKEKILSSVFWEIRTRILGKGRFKRTM